MKFDWSNIHSFLFLFYYLTSFEDSLFLIMLIFISAFIDGTIQVNDVIYIWKVKSQKSSTSLGKIVCIHSGMETDDFTETCTSCWPISTSSYLSTYSISLIDCKSTDILLYFHYLQCQLNLYWIQLSLLFLRNIYVNKIYTTTVLCVA